MTATRKTVKNLAIVALLGFAGLGLGRALPWQEFATPWIGSAWANEERLFVLIVDGETLDTDIASVTQAAASHGITADQLINDGDDPSEGPNLPLVWSTSFPGDEVWLPTGQAGDEGIFALPQTPHSNQNGAIFTLDDYVAGTVAQADLDKIDDIRPLDSAGLQELIGHSFVAVAYASDVGINVNMQTFEANLQGVRYGLFVFTVLETRPNPNGHDDIKVRVGPASLVAGPTLVSVLDENGDLNLEVGPPVADAGFDRTAALGETLFLDGSGSHDPQSGKLLSFAWSLVSAPAGSLAVLSDPAAVKPGLTPDLAGDYVVALSVSRQDPTSFDPAEQTSAADQVVISTTNSAPVADAGRDRQVSLAESIQLDGAGSFDLDGDALTYSWVLTEAPAGSGAVLSDPAAPRPSLTIDLAGTYVATLTVADADASSAPAEVALSTGPLPARPTAERNLSAGAGETVVLRPGDFGQVIEDPGNTELLWCLVARPAGSAAAVGDPKAVRPNLTVDQPGTYVVQLKLRGEDGAPKVCTATIDTENLPPLADAGAEPAATVGQTVTLDAAGSTDLAGDRLGYSWSLLRAPPGSAASLDQPAALRPSFLVDVPGSYVVQLAVRDGSGEAGRPDTLVVDTENTRPRANAGADQSVALQATVQLDGTGSSDPDGDPLGYRWTLLEKPDGAGGVLSDPTAASPSFLAHAAGDYLVELVVSDGIIDSAPDTVLVTTGNSRPLADAGPDREVLPGVPAALSGAASADADGDLLTYRWALIHAPTSSLAALTDPASATPSFTPDLVGDYVVQLIVSDGLEPSLPDTVVLSVTNQPPLADAGPDQLVAVRTAVTLDGAGSSDPDGDPISFAWSFTAKPAGSTAELSGADTAFPSFVADLAGDYVAQLVVNDEISDSDPDLVTVSADANPPLAEAGPDQGVIEGALVTLDGGASADPEGRPLTYSWRFLFLPEGSTASFSDATAAGPSFSADLTGLYVAALTVNDGVFDSQPDTVAVRAGSAVANTMPTLDPIGNLSVALGSTLTLALGASDPGGDTLLFSAAPLPLPEGASLDAASGLFIFTPGPEQVGDIALTFTVSDGLATVSESVLITVTGAAPGGVTAFAGRVLDADAFEAGSELPVVGATVSFLGVSTLSDATGAFTLSGTPNGSGVVAIDPSNAARAPDGSAYGGLSEPLALIANVTNFRDRPFFLMRIDAGSEVPVDPATVTVVENSGIGVRLEVPANSARNADGSLFTAGLSVSELPAALAPASLPASILPCQIVKLLPFGIAFDPAASITLPNRDNLPTGSAVDIWALDPATGAFRVLGQGAVVSTTEIAAPGLITEASYLFAVPRALGAMAAADENAENVTPTALADGNLSTRYALPTYRSLGVDRGATFNYNSAHAGVRPVVATEVTFPAATGLPTLIEGRLEVGGLEVAGPIFTSTGTALDPNDQALEAGTTIRQAISFDGSQFPTGSYPYRYTATAKFGCSQVSAVSTGRVLVNNQSSSPFGSGWTLEGLERLTVQPDGRTVLTDGTGKTTVFTQLTAIDFTGGVAAVAPPPSVALGALEDDSRMTIFLEADNVRLSADVPVNATSFRSYSNPAQLENGSVPQGSLVNSYLVHFDPVGTHLRRVQGTITFNSDIIGLTLLEGALDASDGVVGAPGTSYPTGMARGIELGTGELGDQVAISADRRTVTLNIIAGDASLDQLRVITTGRLEKLAESTFDVNAEGWTVVGNVQNFRYVASGGNPGGFIRADDRLNPPAWYFVAPRKFKGDFSAAYNGWLTFDQLTTPLDRQGVFNEDVKITGAGLTLTLATLYNPVDVFWTHYAIQLNETAGWVIRGTSTPPTQAQMQAVLADLQDLQIVGEYRNGIDTGSLDNPTLWRSLDEIDRLSFARPVAEFSELVRNSDGSFTRRLKNGTEVAFDAAGRITGRSDRNGNTEGYQYDAEGRVKSITDPTGLTTTFVYGADGKLASVSDPQGRETRFEQTGGDLFRTVDVLGEARRFAYDANGRLATELSERGFATTHDYGAAGQWIGSGFPDGASVSAQISKTLGLDALGLGLGTEGNPLPYARPNGTANLRDAKGNPYSMRFNRFGSPIEITDPIGRTTVLTRDENDLVTQVVRPSDGELPDGSKPGTLVTQLEYSADDRGNVTLKREAAGTALERVTRFAYEPVFNQVTQIIDSSYPNLGLVRIVDNVDPGTTLVGEWDTSRNTGGYLGFNYNFSLIGSGADRFTWPVPPAAGGYAVYARWSARGNRASNTPYTIVHAEGTTTKRVDQRINGGQWNLLGVFTLDPAAGHSVFVTDDAVGTVNGVVIADSLRFVDALTDQASVPCATSAIAAPGVTCFDYDANGNQTKVIDSLGGGQVFTYGTRGLRENARDANGNLTRFLYDAITFNLDRVIDAELSETHLARDAAGNITQTVEGFGTPEERTTSATYDDLNRVLTETDGEGGTTQTVYDAAGNALRTIDPTDVAVTRAYDERDRLTLEDDPVQGPVTRDYDPNGNLATVTNALNNSVTVVYDAVNRPEKTIDPLLNERLFAYDAQDNLTTVTDARRNSTTIAFDPLGRQIRWTNPLSETWRFAYDSRDNQTRTDDAKGQTIARDYDALSRLRTVTLVESDGVTVENIIAFTYDANGNRLTAKDSDSSLAFTYDSLNRAKMAETLADAGAVQPAVILTSSYDAVGNRTELRHGPNELVVEGVWSYGYDGAGRLKELVHPTGDPLNPVALGYDPAGRLARIDFPNGVATDVTYDLGGRVEGIAHTRGPTELTRFDYSYFGDGLINSITEPAGTRNFNYDDFQQLTSGGFDTALESYGYDEEGNRLTSHLSASHITDTPNRLREDDTFCYDYDLNGNLQTKTVKVDSFCTGAVTTYIWDIQNRLVGIDFANSTLASYRYDANGRRIEKDVNGAVTRYVYDDDDIVLEYDGSDVLEARYSQGLDVDQPLVMERGTESHFYQVDHLGSVRLVTDSSGSAINRYEYDSFGNRESPTIATIVNPYAFTGRELDPESGLHYYRARYYASSIGRFISQDPMRFDAGDLNLYRYVLNYPVGFTDSSGKALTKVEATFLNLAVTILVNDVVTPLIVAAIAKESGLGCQISVGVLSSGAQFGAGQVVISSLTSRVPFLRPLGLVAVALVGVEAKLAANLVGISVCEVAARNR